MHDIKANFDKILDVLISILQNEVDREGNFFKVGKKSKFYDLELNSLNIASEYMFIDSENLLIKQLHNQYQKEFPYLIDRSQYNRGKKALFCYIERIRE